MRSFLGPRLTTLGLVGLLGTSACSNAQPVPTVTVAEGGCADLYGSSVCTWAEVDNEQMVSVGASVPLAAIQNAPAEGEMVWPPVGIATIPLPDVAREQSGIQSLKIYWEVHGHPPTPYLVPHFDFHFYTIAPAEVEAMDCSDLRKPTELPAGYVLPDIEIPEIGNLIGLCVPQMGMHALPKAELERTEPFTGTLIAGYYAAKPIFFEPMLTRDLLLQQQSFSLDFPQIAGVSSGVTMPTRFDAKYDATTATYRFVFSGFPNTVAATTASQE